jgi:hypothetical protein
MYVAKDLGLFEKYGSTRSSATIDAAPVIPVHRYGEHIVMLLKQPGGGRGDV